MWMENKCLQMEFLSDIQYLIITYNGNEFGKNIYVYNRITLLYTWNIVNQLLESVCVNRSGVSDSLGPHGL